MENTIQQELLALVAACRKFQDDHLPEKVTLHINIAEHGSEATFHGCTDHTIGLNVKRIIGGGNADKANFDPESPWHVLKGEIVPKVYFNIFCQGLPPMCRIEEFWEETKKSEVVVLDETVKVKRTRICCGEGAK